MDPKTFKLDTQWRTGRDNWRFDGFINRNHEWPSVRKRFGPSKSRSESQFRNVFITAPKSRACSTYFVLYGDERKIHLRVELKLKLIKCRRSCAQRETVK